MPKKGKFKKGKSVPLHKLSDILPPSEQGDNDVTDEGFVVVASVAEKAVLSVLDISANSHGAMVLAKANDLNVEFKALDITKGETRAPEFVAKNPFHICPTLESGSGNTVWESNAILRYLADKNGLSEWYPTEAAARAKVDMVLDWRQCNLYPAIAKCTYPALGFSPRRDLVVAGRQAVAEHLGMMERVYLKDGKFLGGSSVPTIADLAVRPALAFLRAIDYGFPAATKAYMERFDAAVPCYKEVVEPLEHYISGLKPQADIVYILDVSANSHGAMVLAQENTLSVEFQALDITKGETRAPEFVAKNPFHICPTLESGSGNMVWESNAILRYLADKNGLSEWYPTEAAARAKVDMVLDWRQCNLYPAIAKCTYPALGFAQGDEASVAEGKAKVAEHLGMMEQVYLKDGKFLGGSSVPTIADLAVRPALAFLRAIDYGFPAATKAYMERFDSAVSSYQAVCKPFDGYLKTLKPSPKTTKVALKRALKTPRRALRDRGNAVSTFASWSRPAPASTGPKWIESKRPSATPQWIQTVRPNLEKELNTLRDLHAQELSRNASDKKTKEGKESQKPAEPSSEKDADSVPSYSAGHFHYKGCVRDCPTQFQSRDCGCEARKAGHTSLLESLAAQSIGRKRADAATLYVLAVSANSHGAMVLAKAAGVRVTVKELDITKGETRAPEFVAKNPFHICPTLESGSGNMVWESNAILRYLADKNGLSEWYPTEAAARAKVDMVLDWRQCNLYPAIAKCTYPALGFAQGDEASVAEEAKVAEHLGMMEQVYLKDGKFLGGSSVPTIADLAVRPALAFLRAIDYGFPAATKAYMERFDAAVPCYTEVSRPYSGYLAQLKGLDLPEELHPSKKHKREASETAQSHKKQRKQPKDEGTPEEQLQKRQEDLLAGCDELEKRMWQHLGHRQEKINSNLESLAALFAQLEAFNDESDVADLLAEPEHETKKRVLEAGMDKDHEIKRQKNKPTESVVKSPTKRASRVRRGSVSDLKFGPYQADRFDSNIVTHIFKSVVSQLVQQVPKLADCPSAIKGFLSQYPKHFIKAEFDTAQGPYRVQILATREQPTSGRINLVAAKEVPDSEFVCASIAKLKA